jgi:tetraacyldisaccharide 4'-kinase
MVRWLWTSRRLDARAVRALLVPASGLWGAAMRVRAGAYRRGWCATHDLPLPSVALGNLTVGGSGKTPLAGWVAEHYVHRGLVPGILLRGVGGDEALVHREAVPQAIVVPDPDRRAGAMRALEMGAQVLVLDDAYQRMDVARDFNICLISAETTRAVRWHLPAGPWREQWPALDRADAIIVTRKRADASTAQALARTLQARVAGPVAMCASRARCGGAWAGLRTRRSDISTRCGSPGGGGERDRRSRCLRDAGEAHRCAGPGRDLEGSPSVPGRGCRVARACRARRADHVVVTAKDAVKLRDRWPASVPEPLVAMLAVAFEAGEDALCAAIDRTVGDRA